MEQGSRRNLGLGLLIAGAVMLFVFPALFKGPTPEQVSYTRLVEQIAEGKVRSITVSGPRAEVQLRDGAPAQSVTLAAEQSQLEKLVLDYNGRHRETAIELRYQMEPPSLLLMLYPLLLPLIMIGGLLFFMRQAQSGQRQAMFFGKSTARLNMGDKPQVTFADVAGAEEAKQELREVVEFLKFPERFARLGARIPKGALLVGPPGTGKTLLARAVAGEAGVPFFSISGSEFVEMFVGVGASRVRDLFSNARRNSPCIIFIDEIDAVGRQRGAGLGGGHDEREQTLNQILVEMDGFETGTNVIILAATNRPDVLDPALLRPGRFDRQVVIDRPDIKGRLAILNVHARGKPLAPNTDLGRIAKISSGFSGADLENLLNEAAIFAARADAQSVSQQDLEQALEKVALGPERRSRVISEHEKRVVAYHEAGHALVGHLLAHCEPIHKISIIARGGAGGVTWSLPDEDRYLRGRLDFLDSIAMSLGGQLAELQATGDITTGASNDIEKASEMARQMVMRFGMSDELGPLVYGRREEMVFLGRQIAEERNYSEDVARRIDSAVERIVLEARQRAAALIDEHRAHLDAIAERLIAEETIEGDAFEAMMNERGLPKVRPAA